jgi:glycosyltransferase involved in cell wall biosynthesis
MSARGGLIVCFGRNVGDLCIKAVPQIAAGCPDLDLQFVMSDWLAEDQIRRAALYWVLDAAAGLGDIRFALQCGIPLLVPEYSPALRQACIEGNCGLFYRNAEEAVACAIYLVRNPATAAAMGQNARRFCAANPPRYGTVMGAGR